MKRIVIVGNSGAGKSTLAADLASRLAVPLIPSDGFYWEPGWLPAPPAVVRQRLTDAVAGEAWVIDGNCIADRDIVWGRADTLLWLDYSFSLVLGRVCRRNIGWLITQRRVWSGNRLTASRAWSGIRHSVQTYAQKRETYPQYLAEFPRLKIVHFKTPNELKQWLPQTAAQTV